MAQAGDTGTSKSGKPIWFDGTQWMYGSPPAPDPAAPIHVADANSDGKVSFGEDVGAAIQSGLRRGTAGVVGLPGAIMNTFDDARVALGGESHGHRFMGFPEAQQKMDQVWDAANNLTGSPNIPTGYQPTTGPGRYAQTGAEFFVGAPMAGGKAAQALGATAASALGSQGAADVANRLAPGSGTAEAVARLGGAIAGPMAASSALKTFTPNPKGTKAHQQAVSKLQDEGVELTGGQTSGDRTILSQEAATTAGRELIENATNTYTRAAMRKAVDPRVANHVRYNLGEFDNAGAVADALDQTRTLMDDLASGNTLNTTQSLLDEAGDIASRYNKQVGHYNKSPYFDSVLDDLKNNGTLSGEDFQIMRTTLRELAEGGDGVTRNAASKMLTALTDAMENQLVRQGKSEVVDLYRGARQTFRDLKTLEDAFGMAGTLETGNLTPAALGSAAKRKDGASSMLRDTAATFSSLVRNGRKALILPKTSGTAENLAAMSGAATGPGLLGATLGQAVAGPGGAIVGGAAGASVPILRNRIRASGIGQAAAKGHLQYESLPGMRLNTSKVRSATQAPASITRPWWEEEEKRR